MLFRNTAIILVMDIQWGHWFTLDSPGEKTLGFYVRIPEVDIVCFRPLFTHTRVYLVSQR